MACTCRRHPRRRAPRCPRPPALLRPSPSLAAAVEYIAAFLLLTTFLVPFAFFLGMSGDYTTLPGVRQHGVPPMGSAAGPLRTCTCSCQLRPGVLMPRRTPTCAVASRLQAGGAWSLPHSGSAGSLQRTASGRVPAPAERKRRGLMLRLFDTLRCGRGCGRAGGGRDVLTARSSLVGGSLARLPPPCARHLWPHLPPPPHGCLPAGASATLCCRSSQSSCPTPAT